MSDWYKNINVNTLRYNHIDLNLSVQTRVGVILRKFCCVTIDFDGICINVAIFIWIFTGYLKS